MGRKAPSRVRIPPSPLPAPALGRRLHSCIAAPVAQLDRASVYGTEGQRFESSRARFKGPAKRGLLSFSGRGPMSCSLGSDSFLLVLSSLPFASRREEKRRCR